MIPAFLSHWNQMDYLFRQGEVMIFLDYDGTLVPIADNPPEARISHAMLKAVQNLAKKLPFKVCVISGRPLREIRSLMRLHNIIYVGNHGLEIQGPKIFHLHPGAKELKPSIQASCRKLRKAFRSWKEVWVENKTYTLSVHYRKLAKERISEARELFFKTVSPYLANSEVSFREGKKVWEIRPAVGWNKGHAVLWLFGRALTRSQGRLLPVYFGDDQTDEDAFSVLRQRGITIKVTDDPTEPSMANYYVPSPEDVLTILKRLNQCVKKKEAYVSTGV